MRTPTNRQAAAELKEILHDLEDVTGLKVNPAKSEILLLYDKPTEEQKEIRIPIVSILLASDVWYLKGCSALLRRANFF